ncbi:hypothetical protein BATDEDRAFT_24819 [Batrachochytrium dendrobatidis JAM81]|uniref:Uncharacterized protein n=2 Tax=Batrachochytrium dendrobatidis TaxID=109871 RepID=F4P2T9_BATDJ|nr:uncharacterized protein BATDEDRAFT_24819 [Batrachochytrium dendrobatidis JAM81]KAJ8326075.1 hypothetical protein O5D80_005436 [Batrachochytrium dendrobatidis]OAJ41367.1 hypothetical protein, variant 1 [Batrachochytrium dendrobatidis JEL423]EGF80080.1 hypothetical protein BATDEDRAFT_24819 [Batrachochytrium dendrobatidis JAM81]KAK5666506.1 hypothetical protein QVD99_006579 [Batrachochytrium dendrobatidis]OAJ41368.1 hypothetical protein, variant 2 [Batrachochytrium dendrobatidis JEL423]|eukprot:XP_006678934.1 hypothetical protein BATDEDRAFT_24819 [Batrachochytrium dendrobatidis JAM81]
MSKPLIFIDDQCIGIIQGVLKTHRFNYEACESMQPVYSKDCLHKWIASPRMIHDLLAHFQQKLKEVTLSCGISWFKIKSFEDSFVPDGSTVVRSLETEITVDVTEFELYQVFGEANLTFELKDFKTALAFAELVELPITAHFDQNEGPISFSCVPYPNHFTANFVVAATFNAQGTQTLDPTRSQAAAMQPNQAAIPSLQSGQIQSTGNDSQTPQRQFPKYQLQLQQHQESEQEYEMDASGTIVQPSQNVFKPLPGLHHDYVEVLVPQSPTGTNEQESDLGEEYHSQHEQFYDTTPRSGESKENRLESRLINLMANQDDEFICITTGDKGREYGERKTKKMKK